MAASNIGEYCDYFSLAGIALKITKDKEREWVEEGGLTSHRGRQSLTSWLLSQ